MLSVLIHMTQFGKVDTYEFQKITQSAIEVDNIGLVTWFVGKPHFEQLNTYEFKRNIEYAANNQRVIALIRNAMLKSNIPWSVLSGEKDVLFKEDVTKFEDPYPRTHPRNNCSNLL